MKSDGELLQQFAVDHDEASFAEIVQRHIRFVYAVSLRRLRDPHGAQDATQAVFIALARKAQRVAQAPSVIGWLHRSACYETRNAMRAQAHRLARETEAHRLGLTVSEARPHLPTIEAVLDEVLSELPAADREAILARYFSEQSYAEIGAALQMTQNTARMRVERALEKLRGQLARRGVTSSAAALAGVLPGYATATVPSGLLPAITKASVLAAAGSGGAAAVVSFMSLSKVITGVAVAIAVGSVAYNYQHTSELEANLAEARTASAEATKQLRSIQREIADFKHQQAVPAAIPATLVARAATTPAAQVASPTPVPGVTPKAPKGWFKNGSANDLYEVGVDQNNSWGGMPSAYAKSIGDADKKFGGMMQTISADAFKNQRVKLTGWVKTEDANNGGHLWLRVDGPENGKSLQFDNMDGREPKGTTDWQEYSVVLDVPAEATRLNYGFFVAGKGKMWVNGLTLTPVGPEVPTTNLIKAAPALPSTPVNLGFTPPPAN